MQKSLYPYSSIVVDLLSCWYIPELPSLQKPTIIPCSLPSKMLLMSRPLDLRRLDGDFLRGHRFWATASAAHGRGHLTRMWICGVCCGWKAGWNSCWFICWRCRREKTDEQMACGDIFDIFRLWRYARRYAGGMSVWHLEPKERRVNDDTPILPRNNGVNDGKLEHALWDPGVRYFRHLRFGACR